MNNSTAGRDFFFELGARVAALRKPRKIIHVQLAQVRLAEELGISQQPLQSYECGRWRAPVSAIPALAQHMAFSRDVLFDAPPKADAKNAPSKRGPTPKWQQQMEQIATLPRAKQQVVMQMLDGLLAEEAH